MNTVNEWFVFSQGLKKGTCDKIRKLASKEWESSSVDIRKGTSDEERVSGRKTDMAVDSKVRISDVAWCNDQWLYDTIWPWMLEANDKAGWKYDITSAESSQITRYRKGGFYTWHRDGTNCHMSKFDYPENPFYHEKVRKLSMTVLLNDNFEGGAFEFQTYSKGKSQIDKIFEKPEKGQIVVFPSSIEHRVTPVTKGVRYSLVTWFLGPPMR